MLLLPIQGILMPAFSRGGLPCTLAGRPGVAEACLGAFARQTGGYGLHLLLGLTPVLGQARQSPVVRLRQVPIQDISNLLRHSITSFTCMPLGPGMILMQKSETDALKASSGIA